MKNEEIEMVVLVDDNNNQVGLMPKSEVHSADTPLHRAFSAFLFNKNGELLLQQRSSKKITWPLMWSNSVCGHPKEGESYVDAARRRAQFELGLPLTTIEEASPYRYKITKDGIMENEICPILVGTVTTNPSPNPDEVEATKWISWKNFLQEITENPTKYSEWCIEEAHILEEKGLIQTFVRRAS